MGTGSGVSRGDRNRNARLERLRALVPVTNAIVGIDLAGGKQMVVVTGHDSKVIARRTFRCRAWDPRGRGLVGETRLRTIQPANAPGTWTLIICHDRTPAGVAHSRARAPGRQSPSSWR
jgi:hypothetical protein